MLGAILGDMIGSPYEFNRNNIKTKDFPLLSKKSKFTDDSVMTVAVAHALMDSYGQPDENVQKALVKRMQEYGRKYPFAGYGGRFRGWLVSPKPQPYNSFGNGSAMRVSASGWLAKTLEEALHLAEQTAMVTHNHPEGIKGAQATAAAIFMSREKISKAKIKAYIENQFGYNLSRTLAEIRPNYRMDESCQGSVPEALTAFFEGNSYEDVVRNAVSIGGDSDTIACIAGGIAEAYYGIPEELRCAAMERLPENMRAIVRRLQEFTSR